MITHAHLYCTKGQVELHGGIGLKDHRNPKDKRQYGSPREREVEKAMATHSSTLAWKTPWMEEPGRLQSMGSQRVGHD